LPKTGSWFIWLDGKYYMEVPAECQPDHPWIDHHQSWICSK
jgi:hypothetical protein